LPWNAKQAVGFADDMDTITALAKIAFVLGVIVTGLVYVVHPASAREIAKRVATLALALLLISQAVACLWADAMGKMVLIAALACIVAKLRRSSRD
jgi:uncharacterized protein YjeT (DUF2065 family)